MKCPRCGFHSIIWKGKKYQCTHPGCGYMETGDAKEAQDRILLFRSVPDHRDGGDPLPPTYEQERVK